MPGWIVRFFGSAGRETDGSGPAEIFDLFLSHVSFGVM